IGEGGPVLDRATEGEALAPLGRRAPVLREALVHRGEQLGVLLRRRVVLLRVLVDTEVLERLLPRTGLPRTSRERFERGVQARFPIDEGAVAVERECLEIRELHGSLALRFAPPRTRMS